MAAMIINRKMLAVDGLPNKKLEFRPLATKAQKQFTVLDLPTDTIEFLKPWCQTDDTSCGYYVLHYFHYLLFESTADAHYQAPSSSHRRQVWEETAIFLDNICRCRFSMSLGENVVAEVATRVSAGMT